MMNLRRIAEKFRIESLKFWENILFRKRSRIKSILMSSLIATSGFCLIYFLKYKTNVYYPSVTIATAILITLSGGFFQSFLFVIVVSLLADYLFIPPVGYILESYEGTQHFLIILILSLSMSTLISTLRTSFYRTVLAKQEAERSQQAAQKEIRARELLIMVISHELKNPLTAIGVSMELLKKTTPHLEQNPTLRMVFENTNASVHRMSRLVSDLLDAANFDTGRVQLEPTKVKVKSIVTHIIETFSPVAKKKGIQLNYLISESSPSEIDCDQDRIYQAISNLLANAIKFTKKGSILLQVESSGNEIRFQVKDTGPGIPKEYFEKIFDRFWQAKETAYQGTGLGLSITKGIVEAHGGKIWVESTVGTGSTFFLTLPLAKKQLKSA